MADVYAGFISKAVFYLMRNESCLTEKEKSILLRILSIIYSKRGINFVLPKKHNDRIFDILDGILKANLALASLGGSIDGFDEHLLNH